MTDWLESGWAFATDVWTVVTDAGEAALGCALAAGELMLALALVAAIAPSLILLASGAPLWVAVLLILPS